MTGPAKTDDRFAWLKRYVPSDEGQRVYARELAMLGASAALHNALRSAGVSQKDVAARLGKSKGFVSRALNGRGNLTVGTIADILWACGLEWQSLRCKVLGAPANAAERDEAANSFYADPVRDPISSWVEIEGSEPPSPETISVSWNAVGAGVYEALSEPVERLPWLRNTGSGRYQSVTPPAPQPAVDDRLEHLLLLTEAAA